MEKMFDPLPMDLVLYPSNHLVAMNQTIPAYSADVAEQVAKMFKVMEKADGIGLAAPQVGWNVRLFILGVPGPNDGEVVHRVVWNPEIENSGDRIPMREGCLSFPKIFADITRWTRTHLIGHTLEGKIDEVFAGLAAQAVQHEMDHLDGVLFIERMTPADRRMNDAAIRALADRTLKKKS
jgi:peptide deformylase